MFKMKFPALLAVVTLCMLLSSPVTAQTPRGASNVASGNAVGKPMTPNRMILMLVGASAAVLVLLIIARCVIENKLKDDFNFEAYEYQDSGNNQDSGYNQAAQQGHGSMGQQYPQQHQGYANMNQQQWPQQQHGYQGQHPGDFPPRPPARPAPQQYAQQGYQNY